MFIMKFWIVAMVGMNIAVSSADVVSDAVRENVPAEQMRPYFETLLRAIRKAENGGPGREYGILNPAAKTERQQAGWCAATCWKNYIRWQKQGRKGDYIEFLAARYAPVGAGNDPQNLNKNWIRNVESFLK